MASSNTTVKVLTCASTGQSVRLGKRIASSGEGTVWYTDRQGYLAKLYHSPTAERVRKLQVMVAHPPVDPMLSRNHISLAWPQDLLNDASRKCVGFLMPAISQGVDLTSVYNPRLRKQKIPRFNWRYLHTTALNIAWIIQEIHAKGHVLGDIKPQNMLVNDQALISVIDTDSFQIRDPRTEQIYHCTVGSEGFTPAELLGKELATFEQTEVHDRFRLAVLIHLLLFGDHPFKGKWVGPGDPPDPTELIRKNYWPYTPGSLIQPGPYTIPLEVVHPEVQQCFLRCFNNGYLAPKSRPTAAEWCNALRTAIADLTVCRQVPNHWYRQTYKHCNWCERKQNLGTDIFDIYSTAPAVAHPQSSVSPEIHAKGASLLPNSPHYRHRRPVPTSAAPGIHTLTAKSSFSTPLRQTLMLGGILSLLTGAGISLFFVFQPTYWTPTGKRPLPGNRTLENVALANTLAGHSSQVVAVAVGSNDQVLTSIGKDSTVKRWSLNTGKLLHTFPKRSSPVNAVAFSLNRQVVAMSGSDQTIKVWHLSTGKLLRTFSSSTGSVHALAFDPAGQVIASGGSDKIIRVWSLSTGKLLHTFSGSLGPVQTVTFSPDGQTLASGGEDKMVKAWSLSTEKLLYTLPVDSSTVSSLSFSPDGRTLVSGNRRGAIKVWHLATQRLRYTLLGDLYQVNALAISPDGQTLASGGEDETIKLWNLQTGVLSRILSGHSAWISSVAFSSSGQTLVSSSQDATIKVWRVR